MKRLLLLVAMAGCVGRPSWEWRGLPEGVDVTCERNGQDKFQCAGTNGVLYTCIKDWRHSVIGCGRLVTP